MVYSAGRLRYRGQYIAATCGRGGVTDDKREGDGATPRGTHSIAGLFYRLDRVAAPSDWLSLYILAICGVMIRNIQPITFCVARP